MGKLAELKDKTSTFFQEVQVEMKKVTWPSRDDLISYTITVIVTMILVSIIIGIEDKILGFLLQLFLKA